MVSAPPKKLKWISDMSLRFEFTVAVAACAIGVLADRAHASDSPAAKVYSTEQVTQLQGPRLPDVVPADPTTRHRWAEALGFDAVIYGTASVLQYVQMYDQAVNPAASGYTGFNRFAHGRELAGPGYKPFKSPNADTLYSNAWLDLSNGPVLFTVPDTDRRYYTANFIDMYANATNIGARTHGTRGGRYLVAPANWQGEVPPGVELFRVSTPYVWVLLRILVSDPSEVSKVTPLQDGFQITPVTGEGGSSKRPDFPPPDARTSVGFFRILDFVLRTNGYPRQEEALVARYRGIGIGGSRPFAEVVTDEATLAGLASGFAEANKVINSSLSQGGRMVNGWRESGDKGRYGANYLYRSVITTLGTGSNVSDESTSFTTFSDSTGKPLDGSRGSFRLVLNPPPPAKFFWSVTVYDARTKELHPNPIKRYLVSDRTRGLVRGPNGEVIITLQTSKPGKRGAGNWLPVPSGPFYLGLRAYGPDPVVLDGKWEPAAVEFVED